MFQQIKTTKKDAIFPRVNVEKELDSIETFWNDRAEKASSLSYYNYNRDDDSLYKEDYKENSRFRMMNSMRSVESSVEVDVEE